MKVIEVLSTAILFLLPGAIAPAYAQGQHEEEKQPQQKQQQAKPAQHQQAAKSAQQPQRAQQQQPAKAAPQQRAEHQQAAKPAQQAAKPAQQPQRAQGKQQASRAQPAAGHGRIPDARFRASFGSGHTFHVNRSEFAGGSRRFQYGGYWFALVDPWPAAWLYTDGVYVDYMNGGYFLCDPVHPGMYLSINIG
jgi:DNA mismatch repair ATPase MutL